MYRVCNSLPITVYLFTCGGVCEHAGLCGPWLGGQISDASAGVSVEHHAAIYLGDYLAGLGPQIGLASLRVCPDLQNLPVRRLDVLLARHWVREHLHARVLAFSQHCLAWKRKEWKDTFVIFRPHIMGEQNYNLCCVFFKFCQISQFINLTYLTVLVTGSVLLREGGGGSEILHKTRILRLYPKEIAFYQGGGINFRLGV